MIFSWFESFLLLAAGISIAYNNMWLAALLIFTGVGAAAILRRQYTRPLLAAILVLGAGILYFSWVQVPRPVKLEPLSNTDVTGMVENRPSFDGEKSSFVLRTGSDSVYRQNLQVSCYFETKLQKGQKVKLHGDMKVPPAPGNPGEFDYPRYLSGHRIYYLFSVKQEHDIKIISAPGLLPGWISSVSRSTETLVKDVLPADEAAILLGMLLGNVEGMDENQYSDFQKTGIIHIFSVSGVHVGFLVLLCAWITSLLKLSGRTKFVSALLLMLFYGTMVGWPVCVVRSVLMASLGLLAYYMGRESQLLNSLGLSGLIIILMDPYALFTISFQLSFLATWGLVYLFPLVKKKLDYQSRLGDLILVSLCAQLAVIPLIAYYFNLFSPLSLLSNLLTTYLSGAVVIAGFLTLITAGFWPAVGTLFLYPAGLCIEMILILNNFVLNLPAAFFYVATPALILIACYYAGLFMLIQYGRDETKRWFLKAGLALLAVFLIVVFRPAGWSNRGMMEAVFIDVGQGDSILLKSPQGKFILIDGGGSQFYDVGDRKVLPYLHHRGIRELAAIINTHPDFDHLQGLEKVAQEIKVDLIAVPRCLVESEQYDGLKRTAARKSIPLKTLEQGQLLRIDQDMKINVLYPEGKAFSGNEFNDQSLVMRVGYGDFSMLLTGDVSGAVLQTLIKEKLVKPATIVKVPHHGSKGSLWADFYDKSRPQAAVISVGAGNNFGHPHPDVLHSLEEQGISVYRTDRDGAIEIMSDGRSMEVQPTRGSITR